MRGLPDAEIGLVVERMAPKLDILINGSTGVNVSRAEQSASVATLPPEQHARSRHSTRARRRKRAVTPPAPVAAEIKLLERADVAALKARLTERPRAPEVDFSLFVQLEDLDPAARAKAMRDVGRLTRRARWKQDTASVEVTGANFGALHALSGVSYVEPGQTLHGPEPTVGKARARRPTSLCAASTRIGGGIVTAADVLVGIIDVGGFDFAHEDFDGHRGRRHPVGGHLGSGRHAPAVPGGGPRRPALRCSRLRRRDTEGAHGRRDRRRGRRTHGRDEPRATVRDDAGLARDSRRLDRRRQPRRRPASAISPASSWRSAGGRADLVELLRLDADRRRRRLPAGPRGRARRTTTGPAAGVDQHQPRDERPRPRHLERDGPLDRQRAATPGRCVSRRGRQRRPGRAQLADRTAAS